MIGSCTDHRQKASGQDDFRASTPYILRMRKKQLAWEILRLKSSRAAFVGLVYAPDEKSAMKAAIKELEIRPEYERRLLARRLDCFDRQSLVGSAQSYGMKFYTGRIITLGNAGLLRGFGMGNGVPRRTRDPLLVWIDIAWHHFPSVVVLLFVAQYLLIAIIGEPERPSFRQIEGLIARLNPPPVAKRNWHMPSGPDPLLPDPF